MRASPNNLSEPTYSIGYQLKRLVNDLDLWRQLKTGDRSALERIYREHVALLLRYGGRFSASNALVEDCVQDLFVDLWRRREALSDTDSIRRYLLVALRRRVIQRLDRHRKRFRDGAPGEYEFRATPAHDATLAAGEAAAEQSARLAAAFEQLSDRQREIVYLKYYGGFDYDDIGAIMDLNYQSARNLLSRALKKLKELLVLLVTFFKFLLD